MPSDSSTIELCYCSSRKSKRKSNDNANLNTRCSWFSEKEKKKACDKETGFQPHQFFFSNGTHQKILSESHWRYLHHMIFKQQFFLKVTLQYVFRISIFLKNAHICSLALSYNFIICKKAHFYSQNMVSFEPLLLRMI